MTASMFRRVLIVPLAVAVVSLSGCTSTPGPAAATSSDTSQSTSSSVSVTSVVESSDSPASSSAVQPASVSPIAEVGSLIGCDPVVDPAGAPGATEYATCQVDGVRVQLYDFPSRDAAAAVVGAAKAFGVADDQMIWHGNVMVAAGSPELIAKLKAAIGG